MVVGYLNIESSIMGNRIARLGIRSRDALTKEELPCGNQAKDRLFKRSDNRHTWNAASSHFKKCCWIMLSLFLTFF